VPQETDTEYSQHKTFSNEKDISTFGQEKKEQARLQRKNGHEKRTKSTGRKACQRKKKTNRFLGKNA